ncbi:MAG: hypothetical protein AAFX06_01475 [Planctomycetota bacterium]
MTSQDDHADKYNDPRAQITKRGLMLGGLVVVLGIGGAALSIWARRTHLEKTTPFWGPKVIEALQLAEEFELVPSLAAADGEVENVRLSGMPGLGHLRHTLLDDRSYLWDSVLEQPISDRIESEPCMLLRLTDPTAKRFPETRIVIALDSGWVGLEDENQQVQLSERFREALPTYLKRVANYEPLRSEVRERAKQREEAATE